MIVNCKQRTNNMNGLASIPPGSFYRLNPNIQQNSHDSRATESVQGGGVRKTRRRFRRGRRRVNKINKSKGKYKNAGGSRRRHKKTKTPSYVNYAGRQIGHQSQRQSQSGGFQSDANLIVSSLGNLVGSGFATLKGTDVGASPIPFSDTLYERNL